MKSTQAKQDAVIVDRTAVKCSLPFRSFFIAGFECATHRRCDGERVDSVRATRHDAYVLQDYELAAAHGLETARDGLRWHLIETSPGQYDWSSWLPMLRATQDSRVQVIWDLWHYGTPDWLDIFSTRFVERATAFATAAARLLREHTDEPPVWCPMNEISFFAYMAGQCAEFHPYEADRAAELKRQLARAGVAMAQALRDVDSRATLVWCDPAINVLPGDTSLEAARRAEEWRLSQFEALDMLCGRTAPELGGHPDLVDLIGLNFYPHNQWADPDKGIPLGHRAWQPLSEMFRCWWKRYRRPLFLSETGGEGCGRAAWLHYVCGEVADALDAGVPVEGICWYPITDYPGWDDGRDCPTGLFGSPDGQGRRVVHQRLADELRRQQSHFRRRRAPPRPKLSLIAD